MCVSTTTHSFASPFVTLALFHLSIRARFLAVTEAPAHARCALPLAALFQTHFFAGEVVEVPAASAVYHRLARGGSAVVVIADFLSRALAVFGLHRADIGLL